MIILICLQLKLLPIKWYLWWFIKYRKPVCIDIHLIYIQIWIQQIKTDIDIDILKSNPFSSNRILKIILIIHTFPPHALHISMTSTYNASMLLFTFYLRLLFQLMIKLNPVETSPTSLQSYNGFQIYATPFFSQVR